MVDSSTSLSRSTCLGCWAMVRPWTVTVTEVIPSSAVRDNVRQ